MLTPPNWRRPTGLSAEKSTSVFSEVAFDVPH